MRVVSLNAWGGRRHEDLIPFLAADGADVFCLQEMLRTPGREPDWLIYRDGPLELRQRGALHDEIAAVLPGHDATFLPTSRGGLESPEGAVPVEFGISTLVRATLPVIAQASTFVHRRFSPDSFGVHPRPRNAHCVRLFDYAANKPVTIAHMHGLRTEHGKGDCPERDAQADALIRLIRSVWPGGERLVVCGDLNLLPDGRTFDRLGELGLVNLVVTCGHTDTRTSLYTKPERFADYMLTTPDVHIRRFEIIRTPEVSDHCPLALEFD